TPDGRWVAFVSTAANLVEGTMANSAEIYLRDLQAGITIWASTNLANSRGCSKPVVSDDGQIVAFKFKTTTNNLTALVRYDVPNSATTVVTNDTDDAAWPVLTPDGRFLVFDGAQNAIKNFTIYRWDVRITNYLGAVPAPNPRLISQAARNPVISADG